MRRLTFACIAMICFALFFAGCSKQNPSSEKGNQLKELVRPVLVDYNKMKLAKDEYEHFVELKEQWELKPFEDPEAEKVRKKFIQYMDMRIGSAGGASMMAAKNVEMEFDKMLSELEKKYGVKLWGK